MKRLALRALYAILFAGGLTLLGAGVAHASETSGDDGILSGTQTGISIDIPVTLSGNAISVIGDSSSSDATTVVSSGDAAEPVAVTSGDDGIGSGTQALIDVAVPVTVSGNAISVIGDSSSEDATTVVKSGDGAADAGTAETSGDDSILGGTQGLINVTAPVTLGGNAISVIGDSSSEDATTVVKSGDSGGADSASTSGDDSILGGTQLLGNINAPITLGGNAISIIGDSVSSDATTVVKSGNGSGEGTSAETSGEDSILGGTQGVIVGNLPVTVGGNAISGIGDSTTDGAVTKVVSGGSGGGDATTSGEDSILGGTQVLSTLNLPVTIGGNAISGIGDSTSTDAKTVVRSGTGGGSATTGGDGSLLGGTQLVSALSLPITIGGNAISVIGDSKTDGSTTIVNPPGGPKDPDDPKDPTDPTTPTTPGGGGSSGASGDDTTAASSTLATTGVDTSGVALAALALLAGLLLVGFRRFALRR